MTDGGGSVPTDGGPTVAVAHYPEGAGHATRMLAIAAELESRGATVRMAGGGAGSRFVALNGYDAFEPTAVDFIDTVQDGTVRQVLTGSLPASADRIADYVGWLRETAPDALVTDDMFAAMAALRVDVPLYVLKHDMPGLYRTRLEQAGAAFHTEFQVAAAEAFFYPAVWPAAGLAPEGATRVPPVALEGPAPVSDDVDVVVVPSHYSDLGRIATALEREGYAVVDVGSEDWDPVPSLLPFLRAADVVVCSGYSTVMDAAVAGTPCVVHPATDEQAAVAGRLRDAAVTGFTVAEGALDVLEAVADPPAPPAHQNGAPRIAATVMADVRPASAMETTDGPGSAGDGDWPPAGPTSRTRREAARARDLVGAGGRRARSVARMAADAGRNGLRRARRGITAAVEHSRMAAGTCRRYLLATALLLAAVTVFTGFRLRRAGGAAMGVLGTATVGLREATTRLRLLLGAVASRLARGVVTLADWIAVSERSLREAVVAGRRE